MGRRVVLQVLAVDSCPPIMTSCLAWLAVVLVCLIGIRSSRHSRTSRLMWKVCRRTPF